MRPTLHRRRPSRRHNQHHHHHHRHHHHRQRTVDIAGHSFVPIATKRLASGTCGGGGDDDEDDNDDDDDDPTYSSSDFVSFRLILFRQIQSAIKVDNERTPVAAASSGILILCRKTNIE